MSNTWKQGKACVVPWRHGIRKQFATARSSAGNLWFQTLKGGRKDALPLAQAA